MLAYLAGAVTCVGVSVRLEPRTNALSRSTAVRAIVVKIALGWIAHVPCTVAQLQVCRSSAWAFEVRTGELVGGGSGGIARECVGRARRRIACLCVSARCAAVYSCTSHASGATGVTACMCYVGAPDHESKFLK